MIVSWSGTMPAIAVLAEVSWADAAGAISLIVLAVMGFAVAIGVLVLIAIVARLLKKAERVIEQLAPRAAPLIDRATEIAGEAKTISHSVREDVERLGETVRDFNRQLRGAMENAEERVRQFGVVARVVQEEVEGLMLDATATARGLQAAADALRRPALPRPVEGDGGEHVE